MTIITQTQPTVDTFLHLLISLQLKPKLKEIPTKASQINSSSRKSKEISLCGFRQSETKQDEQYQIPNANRGNQNLSYRSIQCSRLCKLNQETQKFRYTPRKSEVSLFILLFTWIRNYHRRTAKKARKLQSLLMVKEEGELNAR